MTVTEETIINFGKHKGARLRDLPEQYRSWLIEPKLKDGTFFAVPEEIREYLRQEKEVQQEAERRLRGEPGASLIYVIERLGDIDGITAHHSLGAALDRLLIEYPREHDPDDCRRTPDPEDDRILIWEILHSGHKKVVWHFSGWHWSHDEYGAQGALPGDNESLYSIACSDL